MTVCLACGPKSDPGDLDTSDSSATDSAAVTTTDVPTSTSAPDTTTDAPLEPCEPGPACAACLSADPAVDEASFSARIDPRGDFVGSFDLVAACAVTGMSMMDTNNIDLACTTSEPQGLSVSVRVSYARSRLALPVGVGLDTAVTLVLRSQAGNRRSETLVLRRRDTGALFLAAHRGQLAEAPPELFSPLIVDALPTSCPATASDCEDSLQRIALRFDYPAEDTSVDLFDHQAGTIVDRFSVHVGTATAPLGDPDIDECDGGTATTQEFVLVAA